MSLVIFPQFREEQKDSKYPFEDGTNMTAKGLSATVPNNVFIDASIYAVGGGGQAHIESFTISGTELSIVVTTTQPRVVLTAATSLSSFDGNLILTDEYGRSAGVLILGSDAPGFFSSVPADRYEFKSDALVFVAACFIPVSAARVTGVRINEKEVLHGDVALIGENGVTVRNVSRNSFEDRIRVDVVGVPLFKRKNCDNEELSPPAQKFLTTINDCPPDEFGNFIIATGAKDESNATPISVYPTNTDTLIIEIISGA